MRGPGRGWGWCCGEAWLGGSSAAGQRKGFSSSAGGSSGFLSPLVTLLKQIFTLTSGNTILVFLSCLSERLVQSLISKSVLCWCVRTQELFALFVLKTSLISEHRAGGHVGVFLLEDPHCSDPQHHRWAEQTGHELLQAEGVVYALHCPRL